MTFASRQWSDIVNRDVRPSTEWDWKWLEKSSAKVCGGPCGPGRTSMFQLFPVVKGLTPSSRGEGAASALTSSNSMFSYLRIIIASEACIIIWLLQFYRSKQIDGFLLRIH